MIFFTMMGSLSKEQIHATSVTNTAIMSIITLIAGLFFSVYNAEEIILYVLAPLFCVVGSYAGTKLRKFISVRILMSLLTVLIFATAFPLVDAMEQSHYGTAMKTVFAVCFLTAIGIIGWRSKKKRFGRKKKKRKIEL